MIHPIRTVSTTTAMNPPISGQYMAPNDTSGVERDLLVGRGEGPGHLEAALLAEHEAQLAGRPETLGVRRPEGRARAGIGNRTQHLLAEKTFLTACLRTATAPTGHASLLQPLVAHHFD